MNEASPSGLRLGICGKGGAGKSTVTALLARELAGMGYGPVARDADSTSIVLSLLTLGAPQTANV